ncbi:hypothetical protein G5C51_14430 [Streptomyces sp. A7024]|uniref:Uncharacterized protein n=1 Tax=Streptomyces coryli TaxID=1128680 RepID=A0A6G4TYK5_9ACTN|nr:hypothetical protein [Streptomyces coryli]NGN65089.1 hypothetical protein [Streptomyces coryli]
MTQLTAAIAFTPRDEGQSPQCRGRKGEPKAYTYYRCMLVAYASLRRFNPDVDLVLVTTEPIPEQFAGEYRRIGVETLLTPFRHCPPEGFSRGWQATPYLLDALAALRGRGDIVMGDPDQLCVRPLAPLLELAGDRIGVQTENIADLGKPGSDKSREIREISAEMFRDFGEPMDGWRFYGGYYYSVPERSLPPLLERLERAWQWSLGRFAEGRSRLWIDEHFMAYALRALPTVELSAHVRNIPTAPWRRYLTDPEAILRLTMWHLIHEKDLGFQRMYGDAADPASWFWTASDDAFRQQAGAMMSVTRQAPQRALLNSCGAVVEKLTTEGMQRRLKPVYTRMVQAYAGMRSV